MKRKINFYTFSKIFVYLKYLPAIIIKIKNWWIFVLNYLGVKDNKSFIYIFRDGTKVKVDDNINVPTMAVVFIKKDYGDVKDNSTVIDIGANLGAYSIFAAKRKNTVVYAFEPMVDNFKLLEENIKLNKLDGKILPFNLAVGEKKEKRILYLGGSPFHSLYPAEHFPFVLYSDKIIKKQDYAKVSCISLKDIFQDNKIDYCNMLKIDCEGAEFEILYNLPKEYFKRIEKIRLEYHDHKIDNKCTGKKLAEFLAGNGFKLERSREECPCNGDMWFYNSRYSAIKNN